MYLSYIHFRLNQPDFISTFRNVLYELYRYLTTFI